MKKGKGIRDAIQLYIKCGQRSKEKQHLERCVGEASVIVTKRKVRDVLRIPAQVAAQEHLSFLAGRQIVAVDGRYLLEGGER